MITRERTAQPKSPSSLRVNKLTNHERSNPFRIMSSVIKRVCVNLTTSHINCFLMTCKCYMEYHGLSSLRVIAWEYMCLFHITRNCLTLRLKHYDYAGYQTITRKLNPCESYLILWIFPMGPFVQCLATLQYMKSTRYHNSISQIQSFISKKKLSGLHCSYNLRVC